MEYWSALQNESDYDEALARVTVLMDDLAAPDGQIEDADHPSRIELDALVDLIEAYEAIHHPIGTSSAVSST